MKRLLALTLVAAASLTACGGDDTLTAAQYRSKAKAICTDADKANAAIEQPNRTTPEAIADYFQRILDASEKTTKRFRALDPPKQLRKAHEDALKANDDGAALLRDVVKQLNAGGDPPKVLTEARTRLQTLADRSGDAAKRLGVPACADG